MRKDAPEILNDLVQIHNDRIEGYEKAIENLEDEDDDLNILFMSRIDESRKCKMALSTELNVLKKDTEEGSTTFGKIYRAWLELKAVFTGHDRKSILENCEFGEDSTQYAYKTALSEKSLPDYLHDLILEQKEMLKSSHDKIKRLRELE